MRSRLTPPPVVLIFIGLAALWGSYDLFNFLSILAGTPGSRLAMFGLWAASFSILAAGLYAAYRWYTDQRERENTESDRQAQLVSELAQNRASLAKAQRIARLGNWDWDIKTGALHWSDEIYRIFGLQPQQFGATYEAFMEAVHPDDRQAVQDAVNAAVHDYKPYFIEHRVVHPDGTIRFVNEQGEVEYGSDGTPLSMSGIVHDITERKRREDEIHELNSALEQRVEARTAALSEEITVRKAAERDSRDQRRKAQRYLDMAANTLVAVDTCGTIDMINLKGAQVLGYEDPKALIGKNWFDLAMPQAVEDGTLHSFNEVMSGRKEPFKEYEATVQSRAGDIIPMQWHNTVLHDETGTITGLLAAGTDITAHKKYEATLLRAKDAAEEANRAKSGFLSNMSHELRTPMNAILGFGQLLQNENLSNTQQEYLTIMLNSGEHLLTLINEILDLSRIEIGALRVELQDLHPTEALNDAVQLLGPMADKHKVAVSIADALSSAPMIRADQARLRQILVNLISNAIKYNREGGTVTLDLESSPSDRLRVSVTDTGMGIAQARFGELFQPFNRLDAENSGIEGTGVGLVLTKNLIELMGGEMGFDSTEGEGSVFWIEIPLAESATHAVHHASDTPFMPQRILCVGHDDDDLEKLRAQVAQLDNVELTHVADEHQALLAAQSLHPDLVVLNQHAVSTLDSPFLQWCQDHASPPPIMAMCNRWGEDSAKACLNGTFAACLDKPLDAATVGEHLVQLLNLTPETDEDNVVPLYS